MLNRFFVNSPEKLYNNLYDHIQKNHGKGNFSPTQYALGEITKYLLKHPGECPKLKEIIDAKCAANTIEDKAAQRISMAFNDLLNPKFRGQMANAGKLGTPEQTSKLNHELDKLDSKALKQESEAVVAVDPRPYSVMVIGSSGTGRHAIVSTFVDERFPGPGEPPVSEIKSKSISVDNANINLNVEVKGGQELFSNVDGAYYHNYQGVVFVFDATDQQSFVDLKELLLEIDRKAPMTIRKIIVGNKVDQQDRVVDYRTAKEFADSYNIKYVECSAITNNNIAEIFTTLGRDMREQRGVELKTQQSRSIENSNVGYRK